MTWNTSKAGTKYRIYGRRVQWYFVIQFPDGRVIDSREGGEMLVSPRDWGKPQRVWLDYYRSREYAEDVMYKVLNELEAQYRAAHEEVSRQPLAGGGFVRVIRPKWRGDTRAAFEVVLYHPRERELFSALGAEFSANHNSLPDAKAAADAAVEAAERLSGKTFWNPRAVRAVELI